MEQIKFTMQGARRLWEKGHARINAAIAESRGGHSAENAEPWSDIPLGHEEEPGDLSDIMTHDRSDQIATSNDIHRLALEEIERLRGILNVIAQNGNYSEYSKIIHDSATLSVALERLDEIKDERTALRQQIQELSQRVVNVDKALMDQQQEAETLEREYRESERGRIWFLKRWTRASASARELRHDNKQLKNELARLARAGALLMEEKQQLRAAYEIQGQELETARKGNSEKDDAIVVYKQQVEDLKTDLAAREATIAVLNLRVDELEEERRMHAEAVRREIDDLNAGGVGTQELLHNIRGAFESQATKIEELTDENTEINREKARLREALESVRDIARQMVVPALEADSGNQIKLELDPPESDKSDHSPPPPVVSDVTAPVPQNGQQPLTFNRLSAAFTNIGPVRRRLESAWERTAAAVRTYMPPAAHSAAEQQAKTQKGTTESQITDDIGAVVCLPDGHIALVRDKRLGGGYNVVYTEDSPRHGKTVRVVQVAANAYQVLKRPDKKPEDLQKNKDLYPASTDRGSPGEIEAARQKALQVMQERQAAEEDHKGSGLHWFGNHRERKIDPEERHLLAKLSDALNGDHRDPV